MFNEEVFLISKINQQRFIKRIVWIVYSKLQTSDYKTQTSKNGLQI